MHTRIREYTGATAYSRRRRVVVGIALVGMTLGGICACGNWFSFLMLLCIGVPGLLVLLEALTDE